jgi:hypothetical protein
VVSIPAHPVDVVAAGAQAGAIGGAEFVTCGDVHVVSAARSRVVGHVSGVQCGF